MNNFDLTNKVFRHRLVAVCDLAVVTAAACSLCTCKELGAAIATGAGFLNLAVTIGMRWWIIKSLNVYWKESWLNLTLKRFFDLLTALIIALFILPPCIIMALVLIKLKSNGPIFEIRKFHTKADQMTEAKVFKGLIFRKCASIFDRPLLGRIPMVVNVLLWKISVTDILEVTELRDEAQPTAEADATTSQDISEND